MLCTFILYLTLLELVQQKLDVDFTVNTKHKRVVISLRIQIEEIKRINKRYINTQDITSLFYSNITPHFHFSASLSLYETF